MVDTRMIAETCDACGVQALVEWEVPGGTITLCGHHNRKHERTLTKIGVVIADVDDWQP
jgi:hypothetical protein